MRAIIAVLALVILAAPLTAEAHGPKAIPTDPVLLEQYKAGLEAFYKEDYPVALAAWRPLAERETESSAAQLFLGFMYANGTGLTRDAAAAVKWYGRSAEQDNMVAQVRLALLYRSGAGVAADNAQAFFWATLAVRQESHVQKVAAALLEALAAEMTPAQIDEAARLADAWAATHRGAE